MLLRCIGPQDLLSLDLDRARQLVLLEPRVLGAQVRRELFGVVDPIGERIRLRQIGCEVIGLLASKGQHRALGEAPGRDVPDGRGDQRMRGREQRRLRRARLQPREFPAGLHRPADRRLRAPLPGSPRHRDIGHAADADDGRRKDHLVLLFLQRDRRSLLNGRAI